MATTGDHFTLEMNIDVIPVGELLRHLIMDLWIREANPGKGLITENDAKAEGVERLITLPHGDLVMGFNLLEQT